MLDSFYKIFIFPIEWIMKVILDSLYSITDSYGLSIIFLSILINILILPFYYIAENLALKHKKKLLTFKPRADLIKKVFRGQERHFYLKTLYKVNNYHPSSSLKGSLGLLLQVPFFIAAFHFLGNYESFNNNSFLIIDDLGRSDGLFFGINLLPILMTTISLFSGYIYSRNKMNSGKVQLYILSVFFLVFLYFESSALLIYWTVNNIFSLTKIWIETIIKTNIVKDRLLKFLLVIANKIKQSKPINFLIYDIYCQSTILFFGLIFIYKAIPIAASDTGMYGAEYKFVILNLTIFFLSSITLALIFSRFLNRNWRDFTMKLIAFGSFSGLFFSFVMPIEM